jgi:hypothetical protein
MANYIRITRAAAAVKINNQSSAAALGPTPNSESDQAVSGKLSLSVLLRALLRILAVYQYIQLYIHTQHEQIDTHFTINKRLS